jgi:hypothetical protein
MENPNQFYIGSLNEKGVQATGEIADSFGKTLELVNKHCPQGRELAIITTKLEEAWLFTVKGVGLQTKYQGNLTAVAGRT